MFPSLNPPEWNCFRSRRQKTDIAESADLMTNVPGTLYHKWVGYGLYSLQYSYTLFSAVFNIGLSVASPKCQLLAEVMTAFVARMMTAFCPSMADEQVKRGGLCDVIHIYDVVRVYDIWQPVCIVRPRSVFVQSPSRGITTALTCCWARPP